jgi:lipopolysaccharide export LptBFGC system permease protein LptF
MPKSSRKGQRLVGLFLLGCLLFNYPMLELFNVRATVGGVPLLYAYLFAAWALLIALVAVIMERRE